jgi:hypothetical protein
MFRRETGVLFMAAMRCHNVCKVYGTTFKDGKLCIVMKLYKESMMSLMKRHPNGKLPLVCLYVCTYRYTYTHKYIYIYIYISCHNVCKVYGTTFKDGKLCIVMKLYKESMMSLMKRHPNGKLPLVCRFMCIHIHIYAYSCIVLCVCVCVYIYIYIYIYI